MMKEIRGCIKGKVSKLPIKVTTHTTYTAQKLSYIQFQLPSFHLTSLLGKSLPVLTSKSHKETQDIVGSLKDAEDAKIPHDPLQARLLHEAHTTHHLDGLICHMPSCL